MSAVFCDSVMCSLFQLFAAHSSFTKERETRQTSPNKTRPDQPVCLSVIRDQNSCPKSCKFFLNVFLCFFQIIIVKVQLPLSSVNRRGGALLSKAITGNSSFWGKWFRFEFYHHLFIKIKYISSWFRGMMIDSIGKFVWYDTSDF